MNMDHSIQTAARSCSHDIQPIRTREAATLGRSDQGWDSGHSYAHLRFFAGRIGGGKVKLQRSAMSIGNQVHFATLQPQRGGTGLKGLHISPRWGLKTSKMAFSAI